MGYGKITAKQQEILEYIKNEILNRGFPPSVREICEAVKLKSLLPSTRIWRLWRKTATSAETLPSPVPSKSWTTALISCAVKW